jgi:hypothetical protein
MAPGDYLIVFAGSSRGWAALNPALTKLSITSIGPTQGGSEHLGGKIINVKPAPLPRIPKNKSLTIAGVKYKKTSKNKAKGSKRKTVKR